MKLKQLLSQYGETLRVYCAPEDPRARKMRKKKGGNTGEPQHWRVAQRWVRSLNME